MGTVGWMWLRRTLSERLDLGKQATHPLQRKRKTIPGVEPLEAMALLSTGSPRDERCRGASASLKQRPACRPRPQTACPLHRRHMSSGPGTSNQDRADGVDRRDPDELHEPAAVSGLEPLQSIAGHTAFRGGESLGDDPEQHHVGRIAARRRQPSSPPPFPEATRSMA